MNTNYRSRPTILAFTNYLFQRLMELEEQPSDYQIPFEKLQLPPQQKYDHEGHVELMLLKSHDPDIDPVELEAEAIARRILQITHSHTNSSPKFGDFAILLRQKTKLKTFEAALRNFRIPYTTLAGLGFFERQELFDVKNLLKFLHNELDDLALLGALRSEIFALSDSLIYKISQSHGQSLWEKMNSASANPKHRLSQAELNILNDTLGILHQSRADSRHLLPSEFLRNIFDKTHFWSSLAASTEAPQRIANVEKLLSLAQNFESVGFVSLLDFLEQLELSIEGAEREGEAQTQLDALNAVKIMTVHAAKGLEFPVVIVPHLSSQINFGAHDNIWIDPDFGLAIKLANPANNFALEPTRLRAALKNYQTTKIAAEEKRLLYVAFTRAQHHLILSASLRSKPRASDNKMNWIFDSLDIGDKELSQRFFEFSENIYPSNDTPTTFRVPIITDVDQLSLSPDLIPTPPDSTLPLAAPEHLYDRLDEISALESLPLPAPEILTDPIVPQPLAEIIPTTEIQISALCPAGAFLEKYLSFPLNETESATVPESQYTDPHHRSFAMIRGSLIHRAIELSYTPAAKDRRTFAHNIVASATPGLNENIRNLLTNDILNTLEKFENSHTARTINNAKTVLRELPFRLKINSGFISGKIDCLAQTSDSHWLVLDFKTDRIELPNVESHSQNYAIQMSTYAIFAASLLDPESNSNITAALYYTEPDCLYQMPFDRPRLQLARQHIHHLFEQTTKLRQQSRTFKSLPLRSCLQKVIQWCQQCTSIDKPHCPRNKISLLMEQLK